MKIAVVGVTGMVGQVMCRVLEERNFLIEEFIPVASSKSVGSTVTFQEKEWKVQSVKDAVQQAPDIALFSAGSEVSKEYAPQFAEKGSIVIDNSSAWRMDKDKPLIVPEVNGHILSKEDKIIANPNCSTIQLVMALKPLHTAFKIKRLVISTYQSVTGTGMQAKKQLMNERAGTEGSCAYPHQIDLNCIPHCDIFLDNGYTKEEMKLVNETRKILQDQSIAITATAVRVPVIGGHSESVNISFENAFELKDVYELLEKTEGVTILDDRGANSYPMPIFANGKDDVFIGRIRRDESLENGLNLWIVSDNLRKGAATNAVQIAEMIKKL